MRIKPTIFGAFILLIYFGTVFGFQAAGVWSVSGKVDSSGKAVQPSVDDVESIKGWMTLEQVISAYNIPLAELLANFSLPADTPLSSPLNTLENETFSVDGLRTWLDTRTQTGLSETSPQVYATPTVVLTSTPAVTSAVAEATPLPTEHVAPDRVVNAKTTFQNLLDWGVPVEVIESIIGGTLPPGGAVVKDYVTEKGLEFAPIKTALQVEVDKTK
jgi:hypothetical protein